MADQTPSESGRHRVVFTPSGREVRAATGVSVLDAARSLGLDLDSVCGGRGICGRCQVVPSLGEFAKWSITVDREALSPWSEPEAKYHRRKPMADGRRLGCHARVCGDLVIDIPPDSQVHRQIVRKDLDLGGLVVDPLVTLHYVEVPRQVLGSEVSDHRALIVALADQWGMAEVEVTPQVLSVLHAALTGPESGTTVAVREGGTVAGVWNGYVDRITGVAIDIGSTTIAGYLCDLASGELLATAGVMNPQIRFGEDLMSRVSYAMMHDEGAAPLTAAVRSAVDAMIGDLVATAESSRARVLDVFLVGNPIMHHIYLGFDPVPLGVAPFTLATDEMVSVTATDVDLDAPFAEVTFGPCIAGHVGADTSGAILAEGPHRGDSVHLLVDVGTNAEIVLGRRDGLFAASSPTGPAFEGGELSCGVRAAVGAIERVRIDRESREPRFSVIGVEPWSDEAGFAEAVAGMTISGVCGSGIIELVAEMYLAGIIDAQGRIDGSLAERSDRIVRDGRTFAYVVHRGEPELRITQNDVRAVQLAKAALRAGIDLLRERSGHHELDAIRLAGAFGSHIDPLYAMVLGLIPDGPDGTARPAGNASGLGAVRALLSGEQRRELQDVAAAVEKIETATEARFQELFVAAMAFPHATEPTPHLADMVALPAPRTAQGAESGRRRRRRAVGKETV